MEAKGLTSHADDVTLKKEAVMTFNDTSEALHVELLADGVESAAHVDAVAMAIAGHTEGVVNAEEAALKLSVASDALARHFEAASDALKNTADVDTVAAALAQHTDGIEKVETAATTDGIANAKEAAIQIVDLVTESPSGECDDDEPGALERALI